MWYSKRFHFFELHPSPIITLNSNDSICIGNQVQIQPQVDSGSPSFNYSWSPPLGLSYDTILSPVASPLITTQYNLTVTDQFSCIDTADVLVEVLNLPNVDAGIDQGYVLRIRLIYRHQFQVE